MLKYLFLLPLWATMVLAQETEDQNVILQDAAVEEKVQEAVQSNEPVVDPSNPIPLPEVEETRQTTEEEQSDKVESSKAVVGGFLVDEERELQEKRILYKWDAPPGVDVSYYIIEAYADNQLKKRVKKGKSRKNQIVIKLMENETLYVRIAVKAKNGLVSDFSNLSKVSYDPEIEVKKKKKKYAIGLFYAASTGTFEETGPLGGQASLEQNSPFTLGVNGSYQMESPWTIYWSAYVSQFSEAEVSNSTITETPPLEIGFNVYGQTQTDIFDWKGFYYYYGIDFEIFQTFNTDELGGTAPLEFRGQNIFYATVGVQKNFQFLNRFSFVKFSLSPTVLSSGSDNLDGESYTGFKYILYFHHTLWKRWGTGFFLKQHMLSGPGDLTVTRYGINISYRLF